MTPTSNYGTGAAGTREGGGTLDLLLDIELPLTIRFGSARMALGELLDLAPGSVIGLDSALENGVDLLVNGKVVARGTAVTVGGNYGVRISEIAAARDGVVPTPGAFPFSGGGR